MRCFVVWRKTNSSPTNRVLIPYLEAAKHSPWLSPLTSKVGTFKHRLPRFWIWACSLCRTWPLLGSGHEIFTNFESTLITP